MSNGSNNYDDDDENDDDQTLSVFFLLIMMLLALVLLLGRALHNRPRLNSYLSEPALVLLVSVFVSFLIKMYFAAEEAAAEASAFDGYYAYNNNDDANKEGDDKYSYYENVDMNELSRFLLSFSENFFFMVLLPPIMFNSGYQLKRELFFRHLKPIISFAVVGTALSGITTGLVLHGISSMGWTGEVQANLFELLAFGSLITATDTVSVLGVLNAKQVNPHLFSLVFGESAFNDAVAIVMFRTCSHLVKISAMNGQLSMKDEITHFVVEFLLDALACPLLGVAISFLVALVFKKTEFTGTPVLELSLYLLLMYVPFIFAEVLGMSGIVTIFITGMFSRRYVEPNVSDETKHNAEVIFNLVAYLAETCIFIELGLSVFGFTGTFHWAFIGFAFLASLIGRAISIYPISFLYNWSLKERMEGPDPISRRTPTVDMLSSQSQDINDKKIAMPTIELTNTETSSDIENTSFPQTNYQYFENYYGHSRGVLHTVRTPEKRLDKVIPSKFMHFMWFAGLRGAVAYACARDFPDVYGNRNEVVAATMAIVLFSVIIMGACCEPLLHGLNIRMSVDNEEYMREWRNRRKLEGSFYRFEKRYIYDVVVRGSHHENEAEMHLQLTTAQSSISHVSTFTERATTASTTAKTLTGLSYFVS